MIKRSDLKIRFLLILALIGISIVYVFPLKDKVNLGLDLRGGMSVLLKVDSSSKSWREQERDINAAVEKIRNRIDAYGVKETSIQLQHDNKILVQVPGMVDREMIDKLKQIGNLEFKLVVDDENLIGQALSGDVPEGYELKSYRHTEDGEEREEKFLLEKEPKIVGSDLAESFIGYDQLGGAKVSLRFTSEGTKKFAKVTQEYTKRRLAILLDGVIKSGPPEIREPILSGNAEITGRFSMEEVRMITSVLNSGSLPIPLKVEEERSVGPLLGSDSIERGINSIMLGAAIVVVFVLIYYLLGGFIAVICLALNLLFILAGLHLFRGTLTLPGLAGMILTLGMSVDANVLIFERIREELEIKKPLSVAVKNGFNRAKTTIIDANITTLIAALFLYIFGTGPIKGFATTLSFGIVSSIFTSVFVGRTIFSLLIDLRLKKMPMLSIVPSSHINFVKATGVTIVLSLILIFSGMVYFYSNQDKFFGVDFKGGQILEYKITPPAEIDQLRSFLSEKGYTGLKIQDFKDIPGAIRVRSEDDISSSLSKTLKEKFQQVEELENTTIGPTVGKILRRKAYFAIILSLLGILIYVAFRFKHFDFALAAVLALFHDVLITLGFLCFFNYEISLLTVTALLTIAGYSINDTIVIYDRIREISPRMHKSPLKDVVNTAINNTLSRTLITSLTTLAVVVTIFILGGEALKGFSFALIVGIIAGTYSSIYIASPLVLLFKKSRV
ncbi:MAG: protein translocase subunit SecD [Candidatus Omnitrophica bacterium]|nr:protein translocase subunit SecD [Candidatus Omnitrophota bacterium]